MIDTDEEAGLDLSKDGLQSGCITGSHGLAPHIEVLWASGGGAHRADDTGGVGVGVELGIRGGTKPRRGGGSRKRAYRSWPTANLAARDRGRNAAKAAERRAS